MVTNDKDILLKDIKPVEPVVTPRPPSDKRKLSPSSIITYRSCPRQFYYRYIMRLPTILNIHLIKGTVVHAVFVTLFNKKTFYKKDLEGESLKLFEKLWGREKEKLSTLTLDPVELAIHKNDCVNMVNSYVTKIRIDMKMLMELGKAKNEGHAYMLVRPQFKEMYLHDTELQLHGYIDRVHTDWDGQTTIGDYKTSNRYGLGIKDDYELQCGLYALLYNRVKHLNADWTSIIFLRYGTEVMTRVTPTTIKYALEAVKEVRDKTDATIEKEDYPMKESKLCKWCNYYDRCAGLRETEDDIRQKKAIEELTAQKGKDKLAQTKIPDKG